MTGIFLNFLWDVHVGKSSKPSTNFGKKVEVIGGGEVEGKKPQASTSLDARGATGPDGKDQKSSSKVVLENNTDKVLVLREKIRAANGSVRHQIEAKESIVIHTAPHSTYYRLLVYAIEEAQDDDKVQTEDTGLTIDSDTLGDSARIVIFKNDAGKYSISTF